MDWMNILSISDPNEATDELIQKIQFCTKQAEITIKKKHNNNKIPRKDWITKGIIISCEHAELLFNIWDLDRRNLELKSAYKKYELVLNKVIKNAKMIHDGEKISKVQNEPKKLWKTMNQIMGKESKRESKVEFIFDKSQKRIADPLEISNTMNEYFATVGKDLADSIQTTYRPNFTLPPVTENTIFLNPTCRTEFLKIINDLKRKSEGVVGISAKTLKILAEFIADPLVHIINKSIELAIWPEKLILAEIKPIPKEGDKHLLCNHRPISLISNLAKNYVQLNFYAIWRG